jgi:chromosome segregation ATPase
LDRQLAARVEEIQVLEQSATAAERQQDMLNSQIEEGRRRSTELDQQLSGRTEDVQGLEQRAVAAEEEVGSLTAQLEGGRQRVVEFEQRLSERTQGIQVLEQQAEAAERDKDSLNTQLEEARQRAADLGNQLSERNLEIQGLEQRATTAESERANVTSLYFKLESELKQAGLRTTDLEHQISTSLEVQQVGQRAAEAEKQIESLNRQQSVARPGLVRKIRELVGTASETSRSRGSRPEIAQQDGKQQVIRRARNHLCGVWRAPGHRQDGRSSERFRRLGPVELASAAFRHKLRTGRPPAGWGNTHRTKRWNGWPCFSP